MGTNMMPPPPPGPGGPSAGPGGPPADAAAPNYPPAFGKAADSVSQNLAIMLKICHQQDPNSPMCDALSQMIKATAEIEKHAGIGGGTPSHPDAESPAEDAGEPPMAEQAEGGPPPGGSGNPAFAQAAEGVHQQMMAKKRPPMGA